MGLTVTAVILALVLAAPYGPLSGDVLLAAMGLTLGNFTVLALGPRQDGQQTNLDESVVAAALILSIDGFEWAVLAYFVAYPSLRRALGVAQRIRVSSRKKAWFNAASGAAGFLTALATFELLTGLTIPAPLAAVLASVAHWSVTTGLVALVMLAADRGLTPRQIAAPFGLGGLNSVVFALAGIGIAGVAGARSSPGAVVFCIGAVGYTVARVRTPYVLRHATQTEAAAAAPALLLAANVDEAIETGAAALLGARRAEVRPTPPLDGEVGSPLGEHPGSAWLVCTERFGSQDRFDDAEQRMLDAFARLASPVRAHSQAVARLAKSDDARATILRSIGHDLRSPLAVAGSAVRTLIEHGDRMDDAPRAQVIASIVSNLDRSSTILDDLLELERRSAVAADADPTDVAEVVHRVGADAGVCVAVVAGPDVAVRTNGLLLGRVLDNLVQNALRHAPGSEVILWWWQDADEVSIAVDDGGHGIPEHDRDRVLQAFAGDSEHGVGVGLGLHLAVSFAELAGGRLEIGDSELGGASVKVVLPAAVREDRPRSVADAGDPSPTASGDGALADR